VKICCVGDIHYPYRVSLEEIVDNIDDACFDSDILVLVGDITSSGNLDYVRKMLTKIKEAVDSLCSGNSG